MSREWQAGDVAVAAYPTWKQSTTKPTYVETRIVRGEDYWARLDDTDDFVKDHSPCRPADPRPLVVIDPEDREQVERLVKALHKTPWFNDVNVPTHTSLLITALREFANPTPPRPDEPGLWGVVEATAHHLPRRRWVHHEEDRWVCDTGDFTYWHELDNPVVVREGISS